MPLQRRDLRILFVNPSLRLGSPTKFLPVGIGSVMTYVRQHGYDFDLLDVDIDDLQDAQVEEYIRANEYDVVLTGSIVTHYKWIKWLTRTVKQHHPDTKIIVGNSVAGSVPEVFLDHSAADIVVIGEGELSCVEALNALRDGTALGEVAGIAFRGDDGEVIKTPRREASPIDDFPMIDWDLFDVDKYFEKSDHASAEGLVFDPTDGSAAPRVMPVTTARGCVFSCTFCHYVFWDDKYRHRSAQSILGEIRRNIEQYGATYINFWDDLSFSSLSQAEALADEILASDLKFNWNAAIRTDLFGRSTRSHEKRLDVAKKFREAGCLNVGFSLESGSQEILDMMNKKIQTEYFYEQVDIMKEVGITCSTSVVFGYPIETPETIQKTFDMCLEAGVYPSIGFLLPLPYTGMYEHAKKHGFITDEDAYLDSITERQDLCLNMTEMPEEEVMGRIKDGAAELNRRLELGLNNDHLIKTGGYRKHQQKTADARMPLDPDNLKRTENDVSFNYSQALFDIDLGTGTEAKAKTENRRAKSAAPQSG